MRKLLALMGLLSALTSGSALAAEPGHEAAIRASIAEAVPSAKVIAVRESVLKGFYQVDLENAVVYATGDGKFVLQGDLLSLEGKQIVNLTEQALSVKRKAVLDRISQKQMLIYPAKVKKVAQITAFVDTDCGYCRRLHEELPELSKLGVEVRYVAYPRSLPQTGLEEGTAAKMAGIWCAKNRAGAYDQALRESTFSAPSTPACQGYVQAGFDHGREMGVTGTPAIYDGAGRHIGGYLNVEQMKKALNL